jgi:hypothetical protein
VSTFDDGEALYQAVCERGLEGIIAKRERDRYPARGTAVDQDQEPGHSPVRGGASRGYRRPASPARRVWLKRERNVWVSPPPKGHLLTLGNRDLARV